MTIYTVHIVDYDGNKLGRTWHTYYYQTYNSAFEKFANELTDRKTYPKAWKAIIPEEDNRMTATWQNTSYEKNIIMYITADEVLE